MWRKIAAIFPWHEYLKSKRKWIAQSKHYSLMWSFDKFINNTLHIECDLSITALKGFDVARFA